MAGKEPYIPPVVDMGNNDDGVAPMSVVAAVVAVAVVGVYGAVYTLGAVEMGVVEGLAMVADVEVWVN